MSDDAIDLDSPLDYDSGESEDDVIGRVGAQRANVTATDWTIETIVTQMRKGRLDLSPAFQRRAAWTPALKSKFIESTILAYPIPQIVLAEKQDKPGHFIVIDGKQRLLAIRQFYAGLPEFSDGGFSPFRLSTITSITSIKNFTISRLKEERPDLFDAFETHTIRTVTVRNWEHEEFLYSLFLRLNTGSVPLSPQELRQALVPGPFVEYIDESSGDSLGLRKLLNNTGPDRRMVDAEILTRLIGLYGGGPKYNGNLKEFLDQVCVYFNRTWGRHEIAIGNFLDEMEKAIEAAYVIFDGYACRKWSETKFERAFNRALFDVQVGCLIGGDNVREAGIRNKVKLVKAFKELSSDNAEFLRSVTSTTKTVAAFNTRYEAWNSIFRETTGIEPAWPSGLPRLSAIEAQS
ncbi:DUF262 domain-containing protein [Amycolatopsis decaplanina]|uniref:GmrSD restriction endonucleases N-terminal domain-containing protein n=1 Tax=Amycolatopsis decaplanina DSM 44594 TaxID=1284240 RepID=M2ZH50_9PSEU|nr:DUF262 domain-containing protein [Amycolatopsis decaplanina]EME60238.1 hypothetical protein H074_14467 [Amycolatopsis decaplanina DSM 44594]